jgi:hypothetical protein
MHLSKFFILITNIPFFVCENFELQEIKKLLQARRIFQLEHPNNLEQEVECSQQKVTTFTYLVVAHDLEGVRTLAVQQN